MKAKIATIAAAALLTAASAAPAFANCAARDLGGDWQFYNTWWEDGIGLNWSRCLVSVDRDGLILAVTNCEDSDDPGAIFDLPVFSGAFEITRDCVVTGSVAFGEAIPEDEAEFVHATMTGRKDLIAGVGKDVDTPVTYWTFTMVAK